MSADWRYEEYVYAGVLGKVIGVYMGSPFEGWDKAGIESRWGRIDRYVYEDQGRPSLVVPDDDITGTLTFIRALEDSGGFADTTAAFMGQSWLNYLIEGRTVLWWGGMGNSTEHTAYLRLKHGVMAPDSGSIRLNGKTVAEQIGAQIFIDAFGLVCPGRPDLAAALARRSASVSHDGEAVHAAMVVAAMVAAAWHEKDMNRLLDIGVAQIPADSLVARVHRDVRAWCRDDNDWRKTYDRIVARYGYQIYGGNCHVIPNHAVMVMAWACAPDDFHEAQAIVNTAGWDTDCNAANVGSVMAVKVGLDRICEKYDFLGPFADRVILPTAEGTRSVSDCLTEALHIARIGRKIMGWPVHERPKGGALHHFALPGALHGYMSEERSLVSRGAATVSHAVLPGGERAMLIGYRAGPGRFARVATPLLPEPGGSGYATIAAPRLCTGMTVKVEGVAGACGGKADLRLFVRHADPRNREGKITVHSSPVTLVSGAAFDVELPMPVTGGMPLAELGIEVSSPAPAEGEVFIRRVSLSGRPRLEFPIELPKDKVGNFLGWICDMDFDRGAFSDDSEPCWHAGKNEKRGMVVTGTTDWTDYTFECRFSVHMGDKAGILVRYQGLERYFSLVKTADKLQLVRRFYGDTVLAEVDALWKPDELHHLRLDCTGRTITAWCDGKQIMAGEDDRLGSGGAGLFFERALIGWRDIRVS